MPLTIPQVVLLVVMIVPLSLVLAEKIPIDVAALLMAAMLGMAQVLGMGVLGAAAHPEQAVRAISGFAQPVVITLFALFIATRGLERAGVTTWIAGRVMAVAGKSERRLIFLFTTTSALLSLFMNNLAAGALLLPSALTVARRTGVSPSKLLIPVAYGTLLGGAATYFTTANIIVSDLLANLQPPQRPLHVLDFTPTGGLIAIAGIAFITLFGPRLLPDRADALDGMPARRTHCELEKAYGIGERLWEVDVPHASDLVGRTLGQASWGDRLGLAVAAIRRGQQALFAPLADQVLQAGDVLLTVGREERVSALAREGLGVRRNATAPCISERGAHLVELMLSPHSIAQGRTIRELELRHTYGLTAVALLREGRSYRTDVSTMQLKPGDALLLVGERARMAALRQNPDFVVLEAESGDPHIDLFKTAVTVGPIALAVIASVAGAPVYLAMLSAAVVILLSGVLDPEEAYRAVEWRAIFLVAGMYAVSLGMVQTGLAALIGREMLLAVQGFGPLGLAAGSYLLTAGLTQLIGGQVAALVTGPIVLSAAISMHTSPQAMAVAAAIGCSVSFLTPIAHPVNILMMRPGRYRFGDFFHIGWGLTLLAFLTMLAGMVLFWRL